MASEKTKVDKEYLFVGGIALLGYSRVSFCFGYNLIWC